MPEFKYTALTKGGKEVDGEFEAEDKESAEVLLSRQGFTDLKVKKKPKDIVLFPEKVTEKNIVVFTRQFSVMISAGLPLVQCLSLLAAQAENKTFGKVIGEIRQSVESGDTFSDALRKHPKTFDTLYGNMIEAGEIGGILDTILVRLADYMEKAMKLKAKVKSAMVYPASIVVIAVVVVAFLMIFVIPTFAQMFSELGGTLPGPTRIVMGVSDIFQHYTHYMIGFIIVFIFIFKRFYNTEKGMITVDTAVLKVPVFGPLIRKVAVAKFTRTLGTLISSGVPIIQALDITARTAGQKVVENAIFGTIDSIKEGQTLSAPLTRSKVFPSMVVQMIDVGEETGALDTMLEKIADFYDDEVDAAVDALTSLLEPVLMVFLGIVIGFIVVAMYLPIFQMASALG
ncbi:MAG: type II secretion system F family protein [Nitrospinota bacterium]